MSHNIAQITDGLQDQIADTVQQIADTKQEIERLQSLVPTLEADLVQLQQIQEAVSQLSSNDINVNINVNGSSVATTSVPVQYTPNI